MEKSSIKYFVYARKSTEGESRQILSISSQMEEALKTQQREGLQVVGAFTDSKSAKIPFNRPQYAAMVEQIKKGKAAGVVVWKIDRLTRNHLEGGELIHLLKTGVIKSIWTPQREYQSRDSALLISLEASMAAQYSDDLSENVKRGLNKKIQMGQPPLIARVGYLNTKYSERGTNTIIIDKKRWSPMRKAFDMMLTRRYTLAQIAGVLNNEYNFRTRPGKTRPGAPLAVSVLHRAFTDPFYTGHFYYKGVLHKGTYKPMITLEEFDTIQQILGRKEKAKPHKHVFPFTGLMRCGSCGCAVTASKKVKKIKTTGEYRTYVFYHCTKRKGGEECIYKKYIREQELEEIIVAELLKIALAPKWKQWAFQAIKEGYSDELEKHQKLLETIRRAEVQVQSELETLLDLRIRNTLTDEKYMQKKAERELQLLGIQEKYNRTAVAVTDWVQLVDEIFEFAEKVVEHFKNGNAVVKKSICELIGSNWVLHGKTLCFSRHEWFDEFEKLHDHYEDQKHTLEPKNYEEFKATRSYEFVRSIGCGLRDAIRTAETQKRLQVPKGTSSICAHS